jgi:hypothetical protein
LPWTRYGMKSLRQTITGIAKSPNSGTIRFMRIQLLNLVSFDRASYGDFNDINILSTEMQQNRSGVNLWSGNELVLLTITEDVSTLYTHLSRHLATYSTTDYAACCVACYVACGDIERRWWWR